MRNEAGMKFECIFEEPLGFIDIEYTHLNKTVRYEQRPHGEWICKGSVGNGTWCSVCDTNIKLFPNRYSFCPNCGADMRKENENEIH